MRHHQTELHNFIVLLISGSIVSSVIVISMTNIMSTSHPRHYPPQQPGRMFLVPPAVTGQKSDVIKSSQQYDYFSNDSTANISRGGNPLTGMLEPLNSTRLSKSENPPLQVDSTVVVFSVPPKCGSRTLLLVVAQGEHFREITTLVDFKIVERGSLKQKTNYINRAIARATPPAFLYTHALYMPYVVGSNAPVQESDGGNKTIIRISLIRDPLERKVSHYYYSRNRDSEPETAEERVWRKTIRGINQESYDDCLRYRRLECAAERFKVRLITQFCGYGYGCKKNNRLALEKAKSTVENEFLLVGIMEDYEGFIDLLAKMLPRLFGGSLDRYRSVMESARESSMKTQHKKRPENTTIAWAKQMMKLDYEFYDFIKQRFYEQKRMYS